MLDGEIVAEPETLIKKIVSAARAKGAGIPSNSKRPRTGPSYKDLKAENELLRSDNLRLATERDLLDKIVRYSAKN